LTNKLQQNILVKDKKTYRKNSKLLPNRQLKKGVFIAFVLLKIAQNRTKRLKLTENSIFSDFETKYPNINILLYICKLATTYILKYQEYKK